VSLVRERRGGVSILAGEDTRRRLLEQINATTGYGVSLATEHRRMLMAVILLSEPGYHTIDEIASTIGMGRTTTKKDLAVVRKAIAARYGLALRAIPGKGVSVVGPEATIRQATADIVLRSVTDDVVFRLSDWLKDSHRIVIPGTVPGVWGLAFREVGTDLGFLALQIERAQEQLGVAFSDTARVALLVHLAVAVSRMKEKSLVAFPEEQLAEIRQLPEYSVALTLARDVGQRFDVSVPEPEVCHIALHLVGAKRSSGPDQIEGQLSGTPVRRIVEEMIRQAELYFGREIRDSELEAGLATHLVPTYYRLRHALPVRNPLLNEIRKRYSWLYRAAVEAASAFRELTGLELPVEEIAFIAMHLGAALERSSRSKVFTPRVLVVCPSGIGSSNMLASRLKSEFPGLELVGIRSVLDVERGGVSDADAVVSTVPVSHPGVPCVVVRPMLPPEDVESVRELLSLLPSSLPSGSSKRHNEDQRPMILDRRAVKFNVDAASWEDAVSCAGRLLVAMGYCEPRYVTAMLRQIERFGGYVVLGRGVALPHARPCDGVIRTGLSMVHLKRPVAFPMRENQPVRLVIGLATTERVAPDRLRELNAFLSGTELDRLLEAKTWNEFISLLEKVVFIT